MPQPDREAVNDFVADARAEALAAISRGPTQKTVVRECHAWVETSIPQMGADILRKAVEDIHGPSRESVFTFLRYFDYAQWSSDSSALFMSSEQLDRYLPLHVYWMLTSSGWLFQLSEQPAYVGDRLAVRELARYVADAVDCVGRLYKSLGTTGPVRLELSASGVNGLRVDQSGASCDTDTLVSSSSHTADEWINQREEFAKAYMRDLIAQCSGGPWPEVEIDAGLASEFRHLNARHALVS